MGVRDVPKGVTYSVELVEPYGTGLWITINNSLSYGNYARLVSRGTSFAHLLLYAIHHVDEHLRFDDSPNWEPV
jgi:hypothetical protein